MGSHSAIPCYSEKSGRSRTRLCKAEREAEAPDWDGWKGMKGDARKKTECRFKG